MKIDLYMLDKHSKVHNFFSHPMIDTLVLWTRSLGHEMRVFTCAEEDVDLDTGADIVAFRIFTQMSKASYRMGDAFRQRGVPVIFGGPHLHSAYTRRDAGPHCDVMADSICFEQWKRLLADIESGAIAVPVRPALRISDEAHEFRFPDNLHEAYEEYRFPRAPLLMTTLGCPHQCDFCNPLMGGKYFTRDIGTVYRELRGTKTRYAGFCDATFGLNRQYTIDLMDAIAPLGKYLFVETSLNVLHDEELLDALARGGARWLAVGIESVTMPIRKHGQNRACEDVGKLHRIIDSITGRGIMVQANFICGLDGDTEESFDSMYRFFRDSSASTTFIDIILPHPTTPLFERLDREGRIIDYDWDHYDYHHLVFRPVGMTAERLISGYTQLFREMSSAGMIARKGIQAIGISGIKGITATALNIAHNAEARRKGRSLGAQLAGMRGRGINNEIQPIL
jgi:radical SAM superfamily enzyme YgiQ (UPF0313 family)